MLIYRVIFFLSCGGIKKVLGLLITFLPHPLSYRAALSPHPLGTLALPEGRQC